MGRSKTNRPKLPKGLQEFEASLGNLEYTKELAARLISLPEAGSNFQRDMEAIDDALKAANEAEVAASNARELVRRIARRLWEAAVANWSIKELQEATGYDDE